MPIVSTDAKFREISFGFEKCSNDISRGLVHRKVNSQNQFCRYPFIHLGGERHCESQCLAKERNTMSQKWARSRTTLSGGEREHNNNNPTQIVLL